MTRDVKEKLFEIDSKKIELDFLRKQFLVECKRFAAQAIEGRVRQAISAHPQRAMSLGEKGLKPIKNQVNQMIDSVSDLVDSVVNQNSIWLHTNEMLIHQNFPENHYATSGRLGPEILDNAFKKLLSPIGELLLSSGLDNDQTWETIENEVFLRHPMDWSPEMIRCIDQYNARFNELSRLVAEYETLSEQSIENDALYLWDSL